MKTYNLKIGGEEFEARIVEYSESRVIVELNGDTYEVEIASEIITAGPQLVRSASPVPSPGATARAAQSRESTPSSQSASAAPATPSPAPEEAASTASVTAPIPGVVKQILVSPGDAVAEGAVVLILEAMKMENEISAKSAGTVREIRVAIGDSVQEDQLLIDIEAS